MASSSRFRSSPCEPGSYNQPFSPVTLIAVCGADLRPSVVVHSMVFPRPLVLASRSPRRGELLAQAGYEFTVVPADESAECGVCSGESPLELVARLAFQKAADVVPRVGCARVLACDTVAELEGQVFGKPANEQHARAMLRALRGREHRVHSGLCLWDVPGGEPLVRTATTRLRMDPLDDRALDEYLASGDWEGKAGGFGYQDRLGWVHVIEGSESNVVGLPLELLAEMLAQLPD